MGTGEHHKYHWVLLSILNKINSLQIVRKVRPFWNKGITWYKAEKLGVTNEQAANVGVGPSGDSLELSVQLGMKV